MMQMVWRIQAAQNHSGTTAGRMNELQRIVARTRVLLSTAGPFALYGTGFVDACIPFSTTVEQAMPKLRPLLRRRVCAGKCTAVTYNARL